MAMSFHGHSPPSPPRPLVSVKTVTVSILSTLTVSAETLTRQRSRQRPTYTVSPRLSVETESRIMTVSTRAETAATASLLVMEGGTGAARQPLRSRAAAMVESLTLLILFVKQFTQSGEVSARQHLKEVIGGVERAARTALYAPQILDDALALYRDDT